MLAGLRQCILTVVTRILGPRQALFIYLIFLFHILEFRLKFLYYANFIINKLFEYELLRFMIEGTIKLRPL